MACWKGYCVMTDYLDRKVISDWVESCDRLLAKALPLHAPLAKNSSWSREQIQTIGCLSSACLRASGSALVLVELNKVWDADILLRSVIEASIKFIYLLDEPAQFNERYFEYAEVLPEMATIKNHLRAKTTLESLALLGIEGHEAFENLLLSDKEFEYLNKKFPKKIRRNIEARWSFNGLLSSISSKAPIGSKSLQGLSHFYSMSSRILHADWQGIGMPIERDLRPEPSRSNTHIAHSARVISDVYWYCILRLHSAYKFLGISIAPIKEIQMQAEKFNAALKNAADTWTTTEYGNSNSPP